jgi:hypothetical protein
VWPGYVVVWSECRGLIVIIMMLHDVFIVHSEEVVGLGLQFRGNCFENLPDYLVCSGSNRVIVLYSPQPTNELLDGFDDVWIGYLFVVIRKSHVQ